MSSQGLLLETEADAPVVRGVKVLGTDSKNNREYPKEVMERALKLYDGAPVNIDHQADGKPRKYEDRFGRIVNPRMESDGIYADLIYNPQHPLAESFTWWAKHDPKNVGLSHNAQAKTSMTTEGVEVIDEIVRVDSVDLVAEPATTTGLLECIMEARKKDVSSVKEASDVGHLFGEALAQFDSGTVDGVNRAHQIISDSLIEPEGGISYPSNYRNYLNNALKLLDKAEKEAEKGEVSSATHNKVFGLIRGANKIYDELSRSAKKKGKRKESSVKEASKPNDIINVLRGMRKNLDTIESASRPGEKGSMKADGYQSSVLKNNISGLEAGLNSPEMKALKSAGIATSSIIEPFNQVITKAKSGKQVPKSLCEKCKNLIGYLETATANKKWKKESAVNKKEANMKPKLAKVDRGEILFKKLGGLSKNISKKNYESGIKGLWERNPDLKNIWGNDFNLFKSECDEVSKSLGIKKEDLVIPKPDVKTEDDSIRNEIESILGDDKMESDEKIDRIMACMMPKAEGDEPSAFDEDDTEMDGSSSDIVKMNSEDDDEETEEGDLVIKHDDDMEKPTEESLRRRQNPALKKLLEEVDAYRARDRREKLVQEARQVCEKAGLPKYSITGDFLGILADSGKRVWKNIIEDRRKVIFRGSSPVSTGTVDGKLSVDSLVKALTN